MSQQLPLSAGTRAALILAPLLAAAALALSGCTGSAGAEPSAPSQPAPSRPATSPAASQTSPSSPAQTHVPASEDGPAENVVVPVAPKTIDENSREGLRAFIPFWFELLSYAYQTGNLEPLEKHSGPECYICESFSETVKEGNAGDRWIVGGKLTVTDIEDRFEPTASGSYRPMIFLIQDDLEFYERGKKIGSAAGFTEPIVWIIDAEYRGGQWQMLDAERPKDASER